MAHLFVVVPIAGHCTEGFIYTISGNILESHELSMVIIPTLLMRKLKHRRLGNMFRVTELMIVGCGFRPGLSDPRTQALRMVKYKISKSNKSVKCKQDKIGMRWNCALYRGHLPPCSS